MQEATVEICLCTLLAARDSAFDCISMILLGGAVAIYGLRAKTFRESQRLRILTPANELESYVPRWYHRLFVVVPGVVILVGRIYELLHR